MALKRAPLSDLVCDPKDVDGFYGNGWRLATAGSRHYRNAGFVGGYWTVFSHRPVTSNGGVVGIICSVDRYRVRGGTSPGAVYEIRHARTLWLGEYTKVHFSRYEAGSAGSPGQEAYQATFSKQTSFGGTHYGSAVFFRRGGYAVAIVLQSRSPIDRPGAIAILIDKKIRAHG